MKNLTCKLFLLVIGWLIIVACDPNLIYHSYYPVSGGWSRSDTLWFPLVLEEPFEHLCDLSVEIRSTNRYLYQDIHLQVIYNLEDPAIYTTRLIHGEMADREGRWAGSGWGSLYQSAFPVDTLQPAGKGAYFLGVVHAMEDNVLAGINDVGVKLEYSR